MGVSAGWVGAGNVGGGSVGAGAGASVVGCATVSAVGATAVSVAVIPGSGVGMTMAVLVGVGAESVDTPVTSTTAVVEDETDWVRSASLLDIKPVKATYKPSMVTNKTIRKPKAYPLFMNPTVV